MEALAWIDYQEFIPLIIIAGGCCYILIQIIQCVGLEIRSDIVSWILRGRMRRRITEDLGRKPDESELSSMATWIKVDKVEKESGAGESRALVPKPADDYVELTELDKVLDIGPPRGRIPHPLMDLPVRLFHIKDDSKKKEQS